MESHAQLVRRAKLLAWGGNAWHLIEFVVALAAGIAASSIALVAFGLDSLIELVSGSVIVALGPVVSSAGSSLNVSQPAPV